jgi:hypothetical protein
VLAESSEPAVVSVLTMRAIERHALSAPFFATIPSTPHFRVPCLQVPQTRHNRQAQYSLAGTAWP